MAICKIPTSWGDARFATDLVIEAELIALIYRFRWRIELFFKSMKSILGNPHLMAESFEVMAIQTYGALMVQRLTGKHPSNRAIELIRFYIIGYAKLKGVMALLNLKKSTK